MPNNRVSTTIQEVINKVDEIKPNAFTEEQKTDWITKVEGMIKTDILNLPASEIRSFEYPADADYELLAKVPHKDVYELYIIAMIDFMSNDTESYENDMNMFNSVFASYNEAMDKESTRTKDLCFNNWW